MTRLWYFFRDKTFIYHNSQNQVPPNWTMLSNQIYFIDFFINIVVLYINIMSEILHFYCGSITLNCIFYSYTLPVLNVTECCKNNILPVLSLVKREGKLERNMYASQTRCFIPLYIRRVRICTENFITKPLRNI